ncbi:MAG: D-alanyl-D-alanine carboxypeptidase family protein [Christensenellales bacterium]
MGRKPTGVLISSLVAVLMLAGAFLLYLKAENTKRIYLAEAALTPAPTLAPPTLFAKPTDALLRMGSVGPEVSTLQQKLKDLGFYTGEVDGHFGSGTKAALVLFQQQHALDPDGMAGEQTLQLIYSASAGRLTVTPRPALPGNKQDLPLLVNRTHAVEKNYLPRDLVALKDIMPAGLIILKDPDVRAARPAAEALVTLLKAAVAAGLGDWQVSEGFRTFSRQQELYDQQVETYMREDQMSLQSAQTSAKKTVALPGTSEHHTGLAFDLTVRDRFFGDTEQAKWLALHCWEYGFILRYTANKEDITGYLPEPWHIRFVDAPHAAFMREHDLALEEYLALYQ